MSDRRPKVGKALKRSLLAEAGNKCANPGCPNVLTELHHIAEWHVVKTHDAAAMVAICPACHDAVTRGQLRVDDTTAYRWKGLERTDHGGQRGHLYVEPSSEPARLLLGSIGAMSTSGGLVVFSEQPTRRLSFAVSDLAIMGLEATVSDVHGQRLARVSAGHYRAEGPSLATLKQRPGYFRIEHPVAATVVPQWAVMQMRAVSPDYLTDGAVTLLAMEVLEPNLVRVEGTWLDQSGGMVIDQQGIHFLSPGQLRPMTIAGTGVDSMLMYAGPLDTALFSRKPDQDVLHVPSRRCRRDRLG